ncbi:hypothetical protein DERF_004951 [Dermatophagoides farinae]|uniref:EGF domain-specific O-linked N-acetylglucosamine transferase n=1 Tax=Dermatophagoides farinae TaxID=6954 RepID=A0A922I5U2_DERFA|nr:duf563 domain containing protein [Dermatophagoides farinae]KAH9521280.1 hypothetical protein DERF_004951 [Dermatophagoides farinae]
MKSFGIIIILVIIIIINYTQCDRKSITIHIPSIPIQHVECWLHNQLNVDKHRLIDYCQNNHSNLIITDLTNDDDDWQYKNQFCQKTITSFHRKSRLPCWGYEIDSANVNDCLLYKPICNGSSQSWATDSDEQMDIFFNTADFGYIRQQRNELQYYCLPNSHKQAASLECTKYTRFCRAKNIFMNFRNLLHLQEPIRYREDILDYGDIGGHECNYFRNSLLNENGHKSPLMSWFAEISQFRNVSQQHSVKCDVNFDKPTYIMKLDATINMYHHFCDFINLYLSFHLNGSFSRDNQILIWDSYPYRSNFGVVWQAFTRNELMNLSMLKGKNVCFNDVIFPLLPRMIYGLYYNMPLIPGCSNSGIFRAFNRHLLFHLNLKDSESIITDNNLDNVINITFIKRNTRYRQILNQQQLIDSLKSYLKAQNQTIKVNIRMVDFNHRMPFIEQVRLSSQTDILIGIHGAGLTHTLFQPDYGILFELYNCEDHDCYRDLARLRGIHYLTWQNQTKFKIITDDSQKADQQAIGAAHAKFVNYQFDQDEFVRITWQAIGLVRKRKKLFIQNIKYEFINQNDDDDDNVLNANKVEL